jgi:hypothetical protein
VTGSCSTSSITKIKPSGAVSCSTTQLYADRLIAAVGATGNTILAIPGVAVLAVLNCSSKAANAELTNSKAGTTDIWYSGDTGYTGTDWAFANSPFSATAGDIWHLGEGSGGSAELITGTVSTEATGSDCIFQATAQVTRG